MVKIEGVKKKLQLGFLKTVQQPIKQFSKFISHVYKCINIKRSAYINVCHEVVVFGIHK